jgi:dihydrofolate synthase/folylpolyglutamate synthase
MKVLCAELPGVLGGKRAKVLFTVMRDKDWRTMVPLLAEVAEEVIVTRVEQPRAADPAELQAAFAPLRPTRVMTDARSACLRLMEEATAKDALVVCGSLFLVGEVYPLFSPPAPVFSE